MSDGDQRNLQEVESTERWVASKSQEELLADLKVYLAHLRDNPRSIPDRLRVAAIQQRLGRTQEALIHYEGVLRGYVQENQVMSAIALCQRILSHYPSLPRIQRIMAALYARAPHGATPVPSPVTPIPSGLEEAATTSFVVEEDEEQGTDRNMVVDRVFPEVQRSRVRTTPLGAVNDQPDDTRPTVPYETVQRLEGGLDHVPTMPDVSEAERGGDPALLTRKKRPGAPSSEEQPHDDGELVVLLTRKKKPDRK